MNDHGVVLNRKWQLNPQLKSKIPYLMSIFIAVVDTVEEKKLPTISVIYHTIIFLCFLYCCLYKFCNIGDKNFDQLKIIN